MMRAALSIALVFALSSPPLAIGASCDAKEYAQYKDNARTPSGRWILGMDYCRMKEAGECVQERSKIVDAMLAAQDPQMVYWAQKGCVGDAPGRSWPARPAAPAPTK